MKFSFTEQSGEDIVVNLDSPDFNAIEYRVNLDDPETYHVRVNYTWYILHSTYTSERAWRLFDKLARKMDKYAKSNDKKLYVLLISSKECMREIYTFQEVRGSVW